MVIPIFLRRKKFNLYSFTDLFMKILGGRREKNGVSQFLFDSFYSIFFSNQYHTLIQVFCFFVYYFAFCVADCSLLIVITFCPIAKFPLIIQRLFFLRFDYFFYKLGGIKRRRIRKTKNFSRL